MKNIESLANPKIKWAKRIASGNTNSDEKNIVLAEGHKLVLDALDSNIIPLDIFVSEEYDNIDNLPNDCTHIVSAKIMKSITTMVVSPKIIGFFEYEIGSDLSTIFSESDLIVVLDRIQDPGNLGTIMRTAEALGAGAIICLSGSCYPTNNKAVRASMGSIFRIPVYYKIDIEAVFKEIKINDFESIYMDMEGRNFHEFRFPSKAAIFFGQEGSGISEKISEECETALAIPMQGKVESLNVATSVAICLYEWQKQNKRV